MSATEKLLKVFLDTSALLSGLNSPLGASGLILSFFKLEKIQIVISPEVLEEAEREPSKINFLFCTPPFWIS